MQTPTSLLGLVAEWRERSATLKRYGDTQHAQLWSTAADELLHVLKIEHDVPLTLKAAAERTGYRPDYLASLIRRGVIPNAGRHKAPRIRVADLPPPKATQHSPGRPVSPARRVPGRERLAHLALTAKP